MRQNMKKVHDIFLNCKKLPDIMGITETRLKDDLNEFDIHGHSFEHRESPTQAGGTGIYIANYVQYKYIIRDNLEMGFDNCENLWIEILAPTSNIKTKYQGITNLVVGIIYRHPGSQYSEFSDKLCNNIISINETKKHFVIMGNVNINSQKFNVAGTITDYMNNIESAGCLSFIDKATRVCKRGNIWEKSCIDHMYSNIETERVKTYVVTSGASDHFSTLTKIIDCKSTIISKQVIYRRKKTDKKRNYCI